ncbi:MAG: DUF3164 family protein [Bacteroidales bacterium]|nr:DUF3164 family protein [Bacteroidales bacterium]
MDTRNLTPEQKRRLLAELEAELKAEDQRKLREKKNYEDLRDKTVQQVFKKLEKLSETLLKVKSEAFDNFETILQLKKELFQVGADRWQTQQSHTFTTDDGSLSIIIGHNVIDRWDETVSAGVEMVNAWLGTLAKDDESAVLVDMVRDLLKPNKEGQLKANRVLELAKKADEIGNAELKEGVRIIRDAYRPAKTSTFLKAKFKDELGRDQWLPLSMSAV